MNRKGQAISKFVVSDLSTIRLRQSYCGLVVRDEGVVKLKMKREMIDEQRRGEAVTREGLQRRGGGGFGVWLLGVPNDSCEP